MRMAVFVRSALGLGICFCCVLVYGHESFFSPRLSPENAVNLAIQEAEDHRSDVSLFTPAKVSFDYLDGVWFVSFVEKESSGILGNHFYVTIDETNGNAAEFTPGL